MDTNIIVLILVLIVFIATVAYLSAAKLSGRDNLSQDIKSKMSKIPSSLKTSNIHELKSILIEYDKLFDYFLKQKGFKGETMGERLKDARSFFDRDTYNKIWTAHKFRNVLVHEVGMNFDSNSIRAEIYNFQKALGKVVK